MEYFNIDKYKDWEIDNDYSSTESSKFLKKGNKKVEITTDKEKTYVTQSENQKPYDNIFVYSNKTKICIAFYREFYGIEIGKMIHYDEIGKITKEIDNDKPYKFSLGEVIAKVKSEYEVDLEDRRQEGVLERFESTELNKKPCYEVYLKSKEKKSTWNYILIDGTTGEVLFKTSRIFPPDNEVITIQPFDEYLESLKKAKAEKTAYYKTYKGKDYTKEEWDAFEEEWYQDYQKKKNSKGFWDDIFSRP